MKISREDFQVREIRCQHRVWQRTGPRRWETRFADVFETRAEAKAAIERMVRDADQEG